MPGAEVQRSTRHLDLARDLAIELIATYQGAALIANTFGSPDVVARHARRLTTWLDRL